MSAALRKFLIFSVLVGILLSLVLALPLAVVGVAVDKAGQAWQDLPTELKILPSPQRSEVYASDGKTLIATFYDENRKDVRLQDISPFMRDAMVASEDQDFYSHHGYSVKGITRAFVSNAHGGSTQGASTITQQYVRQALTYYAKDPAEIVKATEDTPQRKIREIKYAITLEKQYTKDQILELYFNIAYFGHGAYGIRAASEVYFNKTPDKLLPEEASLLAGLVKAPSDYDPADKTKRQIALERRDYVLKQMVDSRFLTPLQASQAASKPLSFYGKQLPNGCVSTFRIAELGAGFFCDYLQRWWMDNSLFGANRFERQEKLMQGGYKIVSSLDVTTQRAANKYARNQPKEVPESMRQTEHSRNANMLVAIEPGTGRVLAMGVNRNFSNDQSKNGVNTNSSRRGSKGNYPNTTVPILSGSPEVPGYQAGSTFKIFTVVAALENGYDPNYTIDTKPQFVSDYPVSSGDCVPKYCVKNANPSWMDGSRNMYTGFGRSVNTYFIPLQQKVGAENSVSVAKRLGIKFSARGTKNHPSDHEFAADPRLAHNWGPFSLGVTAVTPLELSNAYATLASGGMYCTPTPVTKLIDRDGVEISLPAQCRRVLSTRTTRLAVDVARCPVGDQAQYGKCDGATAPYAYDVVGRPVAGKSGTTDLEKTACFVAFTPNMSVAGMLANTDSPTNPGYKMKHPPVNYAVVYTLKDGLSNKPLKDFM